MPSRVLAWEDVNLMKHHYYHRHRHPQGITLIEVMFASGIALFGLLVVVALIPLAGNEVRGGLQTDRMASLGRNAVREFDIRGMRDDNVPEEPDEEIDVGGEADDNVAPEADAAAVLAEEAADRVAPTPRGLLEVTGLSLMMAPNP